MNKAKIHRFSIPKHATTVKPSVDSRLASKHFDIIIGFDFHMIKAGMFPVPCPVTPFLAMVFDVMDYIHVTIPAFPSFAPNENGSMSFSFASMPMGGSVKINGFYKATATSGVMSMPPLIPPYPKK